MIGSAIFSSSWWEEMREVSFLKLFLIDISWSEVEFSEMKSRIWKSFLICRLLLMIFSFWSCRARWGGRKSLENSWEVRFFSVCILMRERMRGSMLKVSWSVEAMSWLRFWWYSCIFAEFLMRSCCSSGVKRSFSIAMSSCWLGSWMLRSVLVFSHMLIRFWSLLKLRWSSHWSFPLVRLK